MLGKLIKYELKATGRILLPIYGLMLLFCLLTDSFFKTSLDFLTGIVTLLFVGICVASIIVTIVITIQRFQRNLLTDEGYLMFTLPLSINKLILSKFIVALIWGAVGTLIAIFCAIIFTVTYVPWSEIQDALQQLPLLFSQLTGLDWYYVAISIISSVCGYCIFILIIYTALSTGQLPFAGKHRTGASLLSFFGIYAIYITIASFAGNLFDQFSMSMPMIMSIAVGIEIVGVLVLFFLTKFILEKHLNLE